MPALLQCTWAVTTLFLPDSRKTEVFMELLGRECDGKQGWREDDVGGAAGPVALGVEDGGLAAAVEMDGVTIIMVKLSGPQLGGEMADLSEVWRLRLMAEHGHCPGG